MRGLALATAISLCAASYADAQAEIEARVVCGNGPDETEVDGARDIRRREGFTFVRFGDGADSKTLKLEGAPTCRVERSTPWTGMLCRGRGDPAIDLARVFNDVVEIEREDGRYVFHMWPGDRAIGERRSATASAETWECEPYKPVDSRAD